MGARPIIHLGIDTQEYPRGAVEAVRSRAPGYEVLVTRERERIEAELHRIEVAFVHFPHDLFDRAAALRWFQQAGAGADWLERRPEARTLPFTLTSASGVHAIPISEHMLGFLLALARDFPRAIRAQSARTWTPREDRELFELAGKRVLVLGLGAIGERFARLCAACGMEVVGLRRDPTIPAEGIVRMVGMDGLATELPLADVVANTLPLTAETRGFLGSREFGLMKQGAIVLNIGRGATIDEAAMVDALRSGRLLAAGLDVFETEPLPDSSPLWDMENVLITAHYSGSTPDYNERVFEIFLDNLGRYVDGKPLRNVVDKTIGY